jgi:hypothetical protein
MGRASKSGAANVLINAPDLHKSLGGASGSSHDMPSCCDAKEQEMKPDNLLLVERTGQVGMTVRYFFPRAVL